MKKLLLIIVSIIFVFAVGCEPASNTEQELANKALTEKVEEMQKEIDQLKDEVKKVEQTQQSTPRPTAPVFQQPEPEEYQQRTKLKCLWCHGSGLESCSYCSGSGNSRLVCLLCDGTGKCSGGYSACFSCNGRGFRACFHCDGAGIIRCDSCRGSGFR